MTDANVTDLKLNDLFISDTDETKDEQKSFSFDEEAATEEIPPSLISYFETSKSRASVCEKLILEELDDFTTSYGDTMNLHIALNEDTMELNEQGVCETRNENNTSTDSFLLPTPTDTEAHGIHNLSVCTNNEDKTDKDEHMESGKHLTFRTSLIDKEIKENSEWQREHTENQHFEEMKKEERVRQRENDFQEELKKLMEAEKLHQVELQLMEKRAQEKLEHELLLQQELISNLQKHVEEERRMIEEEMKRIKEEEEKKKKEKEEKKKREEERKKREEEKIKRQMQRERMEEEMRRANEEEENRKIKEIKEEEERRNKEEEQRKNKEEEDKRKREEEKKKMQKEIRKKEEERKKEIRLKEEEKRRQMEEEERRNKEGEQRKKKEEEEKRKREEEEEEKSKLQKEMRKKEEERRKEIMLKEEEKRRQMEEEEKKMKEMENNIKVKEKNKKSEEEETIKREQEITVIKVTGKKMEGDKKRKHEEEESLDEEELRKKEWRIKAEEDKTKEADVKIAEELEIKTQQEEKEEGKSEEERKEAEIKKMTDKEMKKKKEKMSNIGNEVQLTENKEKRKKDVDGRHNIENKYRRMEEEKITKKEEWKKSQGEEKRHKNVKDEYRKIEEEISLKEGNKTYETEKEKRHGHEKLEKDGTRKKEGGEINTEADERQMKEEVSETKAGNIKTEGKGLKEEEESKMIIVKETVEKEERLKRVNDLQEKNLIENDCTNTTGERNNTGRTGNSLTSQLEDNSICTSSGPGPLHSDSISFETTQRGDQEMNIIETYTNITMDQQDAAGKLCTSPSSLLWCLPEDTEQKRLSWMKYCLPWSKLSLQNRRKHKGSVRSQRLARRAAEASSLPPLCPDTLLQSTGCKSLQELTTVTLEDLPGCSLSTLVQCTQLRSLSLRRCGLKSLEGISQLSKLCYIDVEENEISFVNCENMTSLRVLRLGHNKLTSIHGLSGTDNLDVLELSHNNITRIAGLESMRKLQRLSVDHNQLISTKGLRDVYTLLHLNCSHNHLTSVEGLENSVLLNTLELRANSLTEPPSLDNHVLLRELHLDDNSISSLQCLTACWLPLMQHLSVAQNRITQLHSMSDFVSLAYLDLRFNCMSELQNVCKSLERCYFLKDLHLTGNPLQQESGWRSTLQRSLPGLKAIDDQETDPFLSHPAVQQISFASASFLTFCQTQFRQIDDLQQQHSRELSKASTSQDTMKSLCQHFTETLKLAEDQRFAHEYGDITVSAGQKTADMERNNAVKFTGHAQTEPNEEVPAVIPSKNNIRCSYFTAEEKLPTENCSHTLDTMATKTGLQGKTSSSISKRAVLSNHQDLDLKNTAAVVIQQQWKKYRQKYGNTSRPPAAEKGGRTGENEGNPESASFYVNESVVDQHYAATVIQAFWRGCSVRRRLTSALAAVTYPSTREDDTFEEVDVDEFVFDEAELEKHWKLQFSEDSSSRHEPVSEQPLSLKFPGTLSDPSQYTLPPPPVWRPKQAWVAGEEVDSAEQRVSPESSHRKSSASTSVLSGISERSEKILDEWGFTDSHTALLMLKRAQKMKSKHQQKKKHRDPSVRLALFRNCSYQLSPEEARNKPHSRNDKKVCKAVLGLQQAEKTEQVKQERAQQWLHTQSGRGSESEHFLPEISSDILNGGRVQLVCVQADTACSERRHPNGLRANSSLSAQPGKQNSNLHRISLAHARKDVTSPKRVTSAPSKKERISFRDNPVQLSGGWGGGKKREKVHK